MRPNWGIVQSSWGVIRHGLSRRPPWAVDLSWSFFSIRLIGAWLLYCLWAVVVFLPWLQILIWVKSSSLPCTKVITHLNNSSRSSSDWGMPSNASWTSWFCLSRRGTKLTSHYIHVEQKRAGWDHMNILVIKLCCWNVSGASEIQSNYRNNYLLYICAII